MADDGFADRDGVGAGLPVGVAAARLGVAPATLRSWGRRYGLNPSGRSQGGHRRYTDSDVAQLERMQELVNAGATPAQAAGTVSAQRATDGSAPAAERRSADLVPASGRAPARARAGRPKGPGGPGGRVLAVPGASAEARGLAKAASRLDADAIVGIVGDLLANRGVIATWDGILRPVLVAAGLRWARTGSGIDIEHVLSEATMEAFRAHRARQLPATTGRPVLLACAATDLHVLPLHVVGAALAEQQVSTLLLGARVPSTALTSAALRTGASGIFVWRQQLTDDDVDISQLPRMRRPPVLVLGGPGWQGVTLSAAIHFSPDLGDATAVLAAAFAAGLLAST